MQQGDGLQSQLSCIHLCFGLVSPHSTQQHTLFCVLLSASQDSFHSWKMHTLEKASSSAQAGQQGRGPEQSEQLVMAAPVLLAAVGQQ